MTGSGREAMLISRRPKIEDCMKFKGSGCSAMAFWLRDDAETVQLNASNEKASMNMILAWRSSKLKGGDEDI